MVAILIGRIMGREARIVHCSRVWCVANKAMSSLNYTDGPADDRY